MKSCNKILVKLEHRQTFDICEFKVLFSIDECSIVSINNLSIQYTNTT